MNPIAHLREWVKFTPRTAQVLFRHSLLPFYIGRPVKFHHPLELLVKAIALSKREKTYDKIVIIS